jgi:hypothetical protein
MAGKPPPRARPEKGSPALSGQESLGRPLSQWLQLMLAELAARREALERARAEEARRRAEHSAESGDSRGGAQLR